jgi:hypothetical protein
MPEASALIVFAAVASRHRHASCFRTGHDCSVALAIRQASSMACQICSQNPFEVGDEITFFHNSKVIEGIVLDIGWYRTNVRSFEREVYVIPNAVFSKNIVLNVSRKNREWRFYETLCIRLQDVRKVRWSMRHQCQAGFISLAIQVKACSCVVLEQCARL